MITVFFQKLRALSLPQLLLLSVILFLPFERLPSFEVAGYTVKLSYLASIACLLSLLVRRPFTLISDFPISLAEKMLAVFSIFSLILSLTVAPDTTRSVIFVLLWVFVFLMFSVTSRLLASPKLRQLAETILLVVTAAVCLFGVYQYVGDSFGLPANLTGLRLEYTKLVFGFPRIQSVALEPLYFSDYLLVPLFLCIYRLFRTEKVGWYLPLLILISTNLILGISRGAYVAALVGLAVLGIFLIISRTVRLGRILLAILAIGCAIVLAMIGIYGINGKKASANFVNHAIVADAHKEASVQDRFSTDRLAWKLFLKKPLTGYGPSSFGILSEGSRKDIARLGYGIVNNEYLELLVETGLFGTLCVLGFLFRIAFEYVQRFPQLDPDERLHSLVYVCGILGILVQYNFFSTLYILYIWIFLGIFASFLRQKLPEK